MVCYMPGCQTTAENLIIVRQWMNRSAEKITEKTIY